MRNVFLTLVLANLLLLAWQFWVDPMPPAPPVNEASGLALFSDGTAPQTRKPLVTKAEDGAAGPRIGAAPESGNCLRVGPLPDVAAAQQARRRLAARGIDAIPIARESQLWLGHWVRIAGFPSVPEAENARQRLVAGGLADSYLMQDGVEPIISLGVFRDRSRADRVASTAQSLGFQVNIRDRFGPAVEQWLLIHPRSNLAAEMGDISLAGDRIMRTERAPCEESGTPALPVTGPPAPAAPR